MLNIKKMFTEISNDISEIESTAERLVLKKINANCNSPISVYAKITGSEIAIECEVFEHEGTKIFQKSYFIKKVII